MAEDGRRDIPEVRRRKVDEVFADGPGVLALSPALHCYTVRARPEVVIPVVPGSSGDDDLMRLRRGRLERIWAEARAPEGSVAECAAWSGGAPPRAPAAPVPPVLPTTAPPAEVLTAREAAVFLRVSVGTLREWARKGLVPCARLGGRLRFRRQALLRRLAALEAQEQGLSA